jgi:hypothetical protein
MAAFEKTQNKLDELRNLTWQNGKLIEMLDMSKVNETVGDIKSALEVINSMLD